LAEGISKIQGIQIDLNRVQTNIVYYDVSDLGLSAEIFVSKLKEKGVLALPLAEKKVRMVTHRGIEGEHIKKAVGIIESIVDKINSRTRS
jgi:threonine aldolase